MKTRTSSSGITTARLHRVQQAIGFSDRQMAQLLEISTDSLHGGLLSGRVAFRPRQKRQLVKLDLIAVLAAKVYTRDEARAFFATPMPKFNDKSAMDLLLEGQFKFVAREIASHYEEQRT